MSAGTLMLLGQVTARSTLQEVQDIGQLPCVLILAAVFEETEKE
jgi:hypothetical protein